MRFLLAKNQFRSQIVKCSLYSVAYISLIFEFISDFKVRSMNSCEVNFAIIYLNKVCA